MLTNAVRINQIEPKLFNESQANSKCGDSFYSGSCHDTDRNQIAAHEGESIPRRLSQAGLPENSFAYKKRKKEISLKIVEERAIQPSLRSIAEGKMKYQFQVWNILFKFPKVCKKSVHLTCGQ
jgi:hypothetical protein